MNWNAVRHVPGSSALPAAGLLHSITDGPDMPHPTWRHRAYLINAGDDHEFWQVGGVVGRRQQRVIREGGRVADY